MTVDLSIAHPYYPPGVQISGGYVPNELSAVGLISRFVAVILVHLGTTLALARSFNNRLGWGEQAVFLWFMLCRCFIQPRNRIG